MIGKARGKSVQKTQENCTKHYLYDFPLFKNNIPEKISKTLFYLVST